MDDSREGYDWERFTFARVRVLRELEDRHTAPEIAARLGMSTAGVRSHIQNLKGLTGSESIRDLGRWWAEHRLVWHGWCAKQAGIHVRDHD